MGLEVTTGRVLHAAELDGPHYTVENVEENYNLPMGMLPDVLAGDGSHVFMRVAGLQRAAGAGAGQAGLDSRRRVPGG